MTTFTFDSKRKKHVFVAGLICLGLVSGGVGIGFLIGSQNQRASSFSTDSQDVNSRQEPQLDIYQLEMAFEENSNVGLSAYGSISGGGLSLPIGEEISMVRVNPSYPEEAILNCRGTLEQQTLSISDIQDAKVSLIVVDYDLSEGSWVPTYRETVTKTQPDEFGPLGNSERERQSPNAKTGVRYYLGKTNNPVHPGIFPVLTVGADTFIVLSAGFISYCGG